MIYFGLVTMDRSNRLELQLNQKEIDFRDKEIAKKMITWTDYK